MPYHEPTSSTTLVEKAESFSSEIRNKTSVPTLTTLLNMVLEVPARATGQEKEIKGIRIGKKK